MAKLTENSWRFLPDVPVPYTPHPNSNYRRVPDTPIPLLFQIQVPPQPSKVGAECGLGAATSRGDEGKEARRCGAYDGNLMTVKFYVFLCCVPGFQGSTQQGTGGGAGAGVKGEGPGS